MNMTLEIIYQDKNLVAINKPSGLLVHKTDLDPNESQFAVQILRDQLGKYVFPIHRIDKPTSGVLLFSLNSKVAQILSQSMQEMNFHKEYIALVRGWAPDHIIVERGVRQTRSNVRKEAFTKFWNLQNTTLPVSLGPYETARYSLVKACPLTGRRHQIRKHLNHISHPIIGDTWYGDRDHNRYFANELKLNQMFLHSVCMRFKDPENGLKLEIKAPLPVHWQKALSKLKLDYPFKDFQ